jgi:hypothetical protein
VVYTRVIRLQENTGRDTKMSAMQTTQKTPAKRGAGRPTYFRPEMIDKAREYVRAGFTREDIAVQFGVNVSQVYEWQAKNPQFAEALNQERVIADTAVASALYQRATGQTRKVTRKVVTAADGTQETHETYETLPPDVNAARYWLNNRAPKVWRERSEVTGADGAPVAIALSWLGPASRGLVLDAETIEPRPVSGPVEG